MTRFLAVVLGAVLCTLLCLSPLLPAPAQNQAPIDWARARQLYARFQRGDTLTPEEQAYLDRARASRAAAAARVNGRFSPGGPATNADVRRAQELMDKRNRGLPLTPAERAFLSRMRGRLQTRFQPPPTTKHTGLVPLDQMTETERYKGEDGGLYGHEHNRPPASQQRAARAALAHVVPRDARGNPSADGKIVFLSMGMSNATQEFSRFKTIADADPEKASDVVIVDGAQGGKDAAAWSDDASDTWRVADARLQAAGVTPEQVQVAWMKQARMVPARFGPYPRHAEELEAHLMAGLNIAHQRFPHLRIVYLSSRIYAGYARTALNPEPYAYESAFVVRHLIQRQIAGDLWLNDDPARGPVRAPVLLWGPYLWADGLTPRKSDGLTWKPEDFGSDGTHPDAAGRDKVARLILGFLKSDPTARVWFRGKAPKH